MNSTTRRFGTDLSNVQGEIKATRSLNAKNNSDSIIIEGAENYAASQLLKTILKIDRVLPQPKLDQLDEELFVFSKSANEVEAKIEPTIEEKKTIKEENDEPQSRLCYDREFLISFQEKCTESIEGLLPEITRVNAANTPQRKNRDYYSPHYKSNPSTPQNMVRTKSLRPIANSASLLSILASPGGGVVFVPTSAGKYTLNAKNHKFIKHLQTSSAFAISRPPVSIIPQDIPTADASVPAQDKQVENEYASVNAEIESPSVNFVAAERVIEPVAEIEVGMVETTKGMAEKVGEEIFASAEAGAVSSKTIQLEWRAKRVKKIKPKETDVKRLASRQKQIDIGKNTVGYKEYMTKIPKEKRTKGDPKTPDRFQVCSKRSWDGQVRKWRRQLHAFDPLGTLQPDLEGEDDDIEIVAENDSDDETILEQSDSVLPEHISEAASGSRGKKVVMNLEQYFSSDISCNE